MLKSLLESLQTFDIFFRISRCSHLNNGKNMWIYFLNHAHSNRLGNLHNSKFLVKLITIQMSSKQAMAYCYLGRELLQTDPAPSHLWKQSVHGTCIMEKCLNNQRKSSMKEVFLHNNNNSNDPKSWEPHCSFCPSPSSSKQIQSLKHTQTCIHNSTQNHSYTHPHKHTHTLTNTHSQHTPNTTTKTTATTNTELTGSKDTSGYQTHSQRCQTLAVIKHTAKDVRH